MDSTFSGSSDYVSHSDEAEAERLHNLGAVQGVGDPIYSEEEDAVGFLQDMGLDVSGNHDGSNY